MSLSDQEKDWLLSRTKRLSNYLMLKVGILAILSVYAIADFVNAGVVLRWIYILIVLLLIFYIYLYIDTKKYLKQIEGLIRSQE